MHQQHLDFIAWAARYDEGGEEVRSRKLHEKWLRNLSCPLLRIDGSMPTDEQSKKIIDSLTQKINYKISTLSGDDAASLVNPFYEGLARSARARANDLFFVAHNDEVLGCVRYCEEEGVPLLRSMLVAERARKHGVGQKLLAAFNDYVNARATSEIFCLPYGHLESFYARIGFTKIPDAEGPKFLQERIRQYKAEGMSTVILMRRGRSSSG